MRLVAAAHQPNYMPWLGYFHKIFRADVFIFLDDVQYSKNSYINRVGVRSRANNGWLTIPVTAGLGDQINTVWPSRADWVSRHLDTLRGLYQEASYFSVVWPTLKETYAQVPDGPTDLINIHLIEAMALHLGFSCRFVRSSEYDVGVTRGDERLVALLEKIVPGAMYLSGKGAAAYQDPERYRSAGFEFSYSSFQHPIYAQGEEEFSPGLSIIDAVMHTGWAKTSEMIERGGSAA